jgi:DMSO reductase family type II enzyme heme b subunit
MAVRISWHDQTPNRHAAQSEAFEDAVAMELYRGEAEPFVGMGAPGSPIDVWFWDADRQHLVEVEEQYPRVVVDVYPFSETQVATAEYDREGTQRENQPDVSLPAVASGNQIVPGPAASGGSSLSGAGPGSSTFRLPKSQIVTAHGDWQEDRWTVILTRKLSTAAATEGISLAPGAEASVAFAVWDGSANDRDGKKLITVWQDLVLEP